MLDEGGVDISINHTAQPIHGMSRQLRTETEEASFYYSMRTERLRVGRCFDSSQLNYRSNTLPVRKSIVERVGDALLPSPPYHQDVCALMFPVKWKER